MPLRQTEGFLDSLLSLMGLDLEAPDHTTLSRREVRALDPAVFSGAVGVLLLTGVAACWLPAWRASRIDPSTTLRTE